MTDSTPASFGFELKPGAELADWGPIATCWHAGLERTVSRCRGLDAPFCHCEHGNMHALMSGADAAGFSTMREVVGRRDHAGGPDGFLDGCFVSDNFVELVEAKWREPKLSPSGFMSQQEYERVRNLMRDAIKDADRYFNPHPMFASFPLPRRRIGVVFVSAWLKDIPSPDTGVGEPWLANYLEQLRAVPHDIMAWSFPPSASKLRYYDRHYPGVVMLAKLRRTEPAAQLELA